MLDGISLEVVDDFQYLGIKVNDTVKDFQHRRTKVWTAFLKINKIWNSNAGIKLKIKIFNASVLSVLLYATESYVTDTALQNKSNAFQCLRVVLKINKEGYATKEYVYKLSNTQPLMNTENKSFTEVLGKHNLHGKN